MQAWVQQHEGLVWWMGSLSLIFFLGSLLLLPWVVARIPRDYFVRPGRPLLRGRGRPVWRALGLALKNLLGVVFVLAGIAMLILPGQGILCIFVGLTLIDFPGKFRAECWLVTRRPIARALQWMRRHRGRPPLKLPGGNTRPGP